MDLISMIPECLTILIVATFVLGSFLKQSRVRDEYIPIILMIVCVVGSLVLGYKEVGPMNAVLQGILCWGASVGIKNADLQFNKLAGIKAEEGKMGPHSDPSMFYDKVDADADFPLEAEMSEEEVQNK